VTICTHNKVRWFGSVKHGEMMLNKVGELVKQQWLWLKEHYSYIDFDEWVIMPNHLHGIIIVDPCRDRSRPVPTKIKPISGVIGAFKTTSSKLIHNRNIIEFHWQRSFYDHIIRNEKTLDNIRNYIRNNPSQWELNRDV